MKLTDVIKVLSIPVLLINSCLLADAQIELMYTATNPDYKPFQSTDGLAFRGEFSFDNGLFVSGYYNETDFTASGPEVGGVLVNSWTELGIGFAFDSEWGHYYSLITWESVDSKNTTYDGYGAHFGYKHTFTDKWTGIVQLGYIDTDFDDWQLLLKLHYDVSDNFAISLGLRDYDLWDYTNYEAGLIYRF